MMDAFRQFLDSSEGQQAMRDVFGSGGEGAAGSADPAQLFSQLEALSRQMGALGTGAPLPEEGAAPRGVASPAQPQQQPQAQQPPASLNDALNEALRALSGGPSGAMPAAMPAGMGGGAGVGAEDAAMFAELMRQMGMSAGDADASFMQELLQGLPAGAGGGAVDEKQAAAQMEAFAQNMLGKLATREMLLQPVGDMVARYPAYLSGPARSLPDAERERYAKQFAALQRLLEELRKEPEDKARVFALLNDVFDLGDPPAEIMPASPVDREELRKVQESCPVS